MDYIKTEEQSTTERFAGENPLLLAHDALYCISQFAIDLNSSVTSVRTETIINDKKYSCKMVCTWKEIV